MEFKVFQKEIALQSKGWRPTFHDVTSDILINRVVNILNRKCRYRVSILEPLQSKWCGVTRLIRCRS